ncbi:hypothetical protein B0H19DRAFT_1212769 [Mycena capillaripes]|nr:hypothetical protein B0H19DRAFT_1212769 [Mycena capillaripes]
MLDKIRWAIEAQCGKIPSDEEIWHSIRDKHIDRRVRNFLWRALHQAFKCGNYWLNIPTFEHWATCSVCKIDDSMEHALLECQAPGREIIWRLCKELWEKKFMNMPNLSIGLIMACSLTNFKDSKGKNLPQANRLFKIISIEQIHNRWVAALNKRLKIDQLLTDRSRYGSRALDIKTVLKTCDGVLMDNRNLPENWIWQSGVLVGIGKFCPPGRNR